MTDNKQLNGHLIAAENELNALRWFHRFGWLTTRQLGRLGWPGHNSGMRIAQRTMKRLVEHKKVLARRLPTGGRAFVLGQGGAAILNDQGVKNVSSRGNRDLRFNAPFHRATCNDYAIDRYIAGDEIWTEHEIQRGHSPLPEARVGRLIKIPDLITFSSGYYQWVEVENTPKSKKKIHSILDLAENTATLNATHPLWVNGHEIGIHSLTFVLPNDATLRSILRAIMARDIPFEITDYIYLDRVEMSSGWIWGGSKTRQTATEWLENYEEKGIRL